MNKKILIILLFGIVVIIFLSLFYLSPKNNQDNQFIDCLAESGVIIYGSETCPACLSLVKELGGYDAINLIYIECSDENYWPKCEEEMKTNYVPEIQIKGELYQGERSANALGRATGCQVY